MSGGSGQGAHFLGWGKGVRCRVPERGHKGRSLPFLACLSFPSVTVVTGLGGAPADSWGGTSWQRCQQDSVLHGREGHTAGMEQVWLVTSSAAQKLSRSTASTISISSSFTWHWGKTSCMGG